MRQAGPGDDLVREVGRHRAVDGHQSEQVGHVLCEKPRGVRRHRGGGVLHAHERDGAVTGLGGHQGVHTGENTLDVPAGLGGQVDHDRAWTHRGHHLVRDEQRGRATGDGRRGDHDVGCGHVGCEQFALAHGTVYAQLPGVATRTLDGVQVEVDEGATHGDDLIGRGRAHVVGRDPGTKALGRGDCLQSGHAGPEHEHSSRRNRTGRGHVEREEAGESDGRLEHHAIAGDQRLASERVHRLGARDARNQLEGKGRRAGRGQGGDGGQLGGRRRQTDRDRAGAESSRELRGEGAHVAVDIEVARGEVRHNGGTGIRVGGVAVTGRGARTGLNQDLESKGCELGHCLGGRRDAALTLQAFSSDADSHARLLRGERPRARTDRSEHLRGTFVPVRSVVGFACRPENMTALRRVCRFLTQLSLATAEITANPVHLSPRQSPSTRHYPRPCLNLVVQVVKG